MHHVRFRQAISPCVEPNTNKIHPVYAYFFVRIGLPVCLSVSLGGWMRGWWDTGRVPNYNNSLYHPVEKPYEDRLHPAHRRRAQQHAVHWKTTGQILRILVEDLREGSIQIIRSFSLHLNLKTYQTNDYINKNIKFH